MNLRFVASRDLYALALLCLLLLGSLQCAHVDENLREDRFHSHEAQAALDSVPAAQSLYGASYGDLRHDVVILGAHGGPEDTLQKNYFDWLHPAASDRYSLFYVYQVQMLDPNVMQSGIALTVAEATWENMRSAAMIYKLARYFQDQGKTVRLIGHSYGSYLIPFALMHYGNIYDRIVLAAGRLASEPFSEQPALFVGGGQYVFDYGNNDKFVRFTQQPLDLSTPAGRNGISGSRLLGTSGRIRYTRELEDVPLSNVFYIYGRADASVGPLTQAEVDFLKRKGARVFQGVRGLTAGLSSAATMISVGTSDKDHDVGLAVGGLNATKVKTFLTD